MGVLVKKVARGVMGTVITGLFSLQQRGFSVQLLLATLTFWPVCTELYPYFSLTKLSEHCREVLVGHTYLHKN